MQIHVNVMRVESTVNDSKGVVPRRLTRKAARDAGIGQMVRL